MNLRKFQICKGSYILLLLFIFSVSCQKNTQYTPNAEIDEEQWISALTDIGYDESIKNSVLLVTTSTHCQDCLRELSYWNNFETKNSNSINIFLVVIERYETRYKNFLENNGLNIASFRDSSAILVQNDFIPAIPVKIYFNENGQSTRIHPIGSDIYLQDFIDEF